MEKYIPVYPSSDDPDIQRIITSKREFNELQPLQGENVGEKRSLLRHQLLFLRLMTITDRIVNIHEPGTGKTCAFIAAAERFKRVGSFHKTIIVEKSNTLITEVKNQILNRCVDANEYSLDASFDDEIKTNKARRRKINQNLSSWYIFETYQAFASKLEEMNDEQIAAKYQKHIIIFDEIHNILGEAKGQYIQYKRLCHLAPQTKICAITATPMINDTKEAFNLLNLLLPPDRQIPLNTVPRLSVLEPYLRGKISFIKAVLSNVKVNYKGTSFIFENEFQSLDFFDPEKDKVETIQTPVSMYLSSMGDLQLEQYESVKEIDNVIVNKATLAGVAVFPIIQSRLTASENYVSDVGGKLKWKNYPGFVDWEERGKYLSFNDWIYNDGDLSNLKRISGKLSEIIEIEKSSEGCSFIYDSAVENAGGVKFISLVFSLFGFEQFTENTTEDIFINKAKTKIRDSFLRKKRIAVITGGIYGTDSRQEAILSLFNSPQNVNGEYIKVLIGSQKTRDGINIYHCRRIHLLFPDWHFSGMIQAINRGLRVAGHNDLKKYLSDKAIEEGFLPGTPEFEEKTKIIVDVYRHCIDYKIDQEDSSDENADLRDMRRAVWKEIDIQHIMYLMKICAVDNIINRPRNTENNETGFLTENYSKNAFIPSWTELTDPSYVPYETDETDYSTYNCLYLNPEKIFDILKKNLLAYGSISYQNIEKIFPTSTREEIEESIFQLQSKGNFVSTPLGEKLSIEMGENGLHLQRFSTLADSSLIKNISIYDFPQLTIFQRKMSDYFKKNVLSFIKNDLYFLLKEAENLTKEQQLESLKKIPRWKQIKIMEELVLILHSRSLFPIQSSTNYLKKLIDFYQGYLFSFDNGCFVHVMTVRSEREKSHNIPTKHRDPKQLRFFSKDESLGWRPLLEKEYTLYRKKIKEMIEEEMSKYEKYSLYGTYFQDERFRIVIMNEDLISAGGGSIEDRRMNQRGKELKSIKKKDRIKIAVQEKIFPPTNGIKGKKETVAYMRESLKAEQPEAYVSGLTNEEVEIYYLWNSSSSMAEIFEEALISKLRKEGRLYEPYLLMCDIVEE